MPERSANDSDRQMERVLFYQNHLNRVSRSFAFCIERLESPLREQVSLAYLICRILDTIEDAPWPSASAQSAAFGFFDRCLRQPFAENALEWNLWLGEFPGDLPEGERTLLEDSREIFSDYHALPEKVRLVLEDGVSSMSAGMRRFMETKGSQNPLRLRSMRDVNQYCFFVAGVVGEMLSRILNEQRFELGLSVQEAQKISLAESFRFGLFLQKINLLKDQRQDEVVGRYLVPSRRAVLKSLQLDAEGAIHYVLSLPERFIGYRLFCSWSLCLGLASLPWIERSYHERSGEKIPRSQTQMLLDHVEEIVHDNKALGDLFQEMLSGVEISLLQAESVPTEADQESISVVTSGFGEMASLYRGRLSVSDVEDLFMAGYGV